LHCRPVLGWECDWCAHPGNCSLRMGRRARRSARPANGSGRPPANGDYRSSVAVG